MNLVRLRNSRKTDGWNTWVAWQKMRLGREGMAHAAHREDSVFLLVMGSR